MDKKAIEYLARRMEGNDYRDIRNDSYNRTEDTEYRRRRREDGTFMRGSIESNQTEVEHTPQGERNTDARGRGTSYAHRGPDDEKRRRIGFGLGDSKSHWSEEEFVGDMEESLYHEVDDIFHYVEIMEKVYKKGYEELACAFYEIANEKFICSEFLRRHLKKIGRYNPSEHKELEKDLEEAKEMFKEI